MNQGGVAFTPDTKAAANEEEKELALQRNATTYDKRVTDRALEVVEEKLGSRYDVRMAESFNQGLNAKNLMRRLSLSERIKEATKETREDLAAH